jgi:thioesterase domain-containing protein
MIYQQILEDYIRQNIPISVSMGIQVESASPNEVTLSAPFLNNVNHKKTVFGGSLHAVATLACWGLLHLNLKNLNPIEIVITHSHVDYLTPVVSDFIVQGLFPEEAVWNRFIEMLHSKGKGRIQLEAKIYQGEKLAVDYKGTFAALKRY